jgi:hypothetical protein
VKARVKLVVDIYEPEGAGLDYPILRHEFYGKTREEAWGYYQAHLGTDEFLRDCVTARRWQSVKCQAEIRWERV